jgi:Protein of unknown function, DUF547/Domain found in Dishevelled, Egl-10, and Pleckstrin (DEP)
LETYKDLVAGASDSLDPRLGPSTKPPAVVTSPPPREDKVIEIPKNTISDEFVTRISVFTMTELLKRTLPRRDLKYNLTTYKNSFKGCEFVNCLVKQFSLRRDAAVTFAQTLQREHHILHHVVSDHIVQDTDGLFFRLQCDQTPNVLNSYRVWTERVDPDSVALLSRLRKQFDKILIDHTDSRGRINYREVVLHEDFPTFEEAVCELQGVDLEIMPPATKLAFCINLYNMMVRYAFAKVGIGTSALARNDFYSSLGFNVSGSFLTFQDLENGVMRANRKAPNAIARPFRPNDSRLRLVMPEADCRLHFCLNCGAKACPPVHSLTAEDLDVELRIAAEAFCNDEKNVKFEGDRTLQLSMIFSWYVEDFGGNTTEAATTVLKYLRGAKAAALRDLIAEGTLKVKYIKYDWTTDASDFVVFSGSAIKTDSSRFL